MKVILKSEVDNLGLPGDVVDVADGYGRNFLIPRGLAIMATGGAMKEAQALTRSRKAREAKTVDGARAAKDALEARTLRIPARVDDRGHLYGSVSAADIATVLKQRGHDVERKRIELKGTIKEIGRHEIPVRVHPQVVATVAVDVVDVEGRVILEDGVAKVESDEAAAVDVEATDQDALAEQALEAAREYEQQQAMLEAERDTDDAADAGAGAAATAADPDEEPMSQG